MRPSRDIQGSKLRLDDRGLNGLKFKKLTHAEEGPGVPGQASSTGSCTLHGVDSSQRCICRSRRDLAASSTASKRPLTREAPNLQLVCSCCGRGRRDRGIVHN